ncbi:hypothetical protein HOY82DRAFT_355300 [Tuber indicum]|nr:hypothetical protein HOY82DRAFT_355300 [Tuber indicum]KAG0640809.1 hypothetical protein HOY80DRAFT_783016 [Tuber brumale]
MGVCLSCLGIRQKDDSEHQRLLAAPNDHLHSHSYTNGNFANSSHHHSIPDPQALLHEREYLDRLVAQTSENLIDIFAPPMLTHSNSTATPNSRGEWYRSVLSKTSPPNHGPEMPVVLDPGVVGGPEREWLESVLKGGEEAVREVGKVKGVGKLVVGLDYEG